MYCKLNCLNSFCTCHGCNNCSSATLLEVFVGHYGNDPAGSVFFNLLIVSRSTAELSPPISTFIGLRSHVNLPCLLILTLCFFKYMGKINHKCFFWQNHVLFSFRVRKRRSHFLCRQIAQWLHRRGPKPSKSPCPFVSGYAPPSILPTPRARTGSS